MDFIITLVLLLFCPFIFPLAIFGYCELRIPFLITLAAWVGTAIWVVNSGG